MIKDIEDIHPEIVMGLDKIFTGIRSTVIEECVQVVKERMRRSDSTVWVQIHDDIITALRTLKKKP